MRYLLMIYTDEKAEAAKSEADMGALLGEYNAYTAAVTKAGKFQAGEALQPTSTSTSVRVRGGKKLVTDGPFAETKEQLGGFYLIDVRDLDEALAWAARIPTARIGCVEVRPVWE